MNAKPAAGIPFRLLRYFSLTSIAGIFLAAVVLVVLYRSVAVSTLTDIGETVNLNLARTALLSVKPEVTRFLDQTYETDDGVDGGYLAAAVETLKEDSGIAKVKLYDVFGTVLYSTNPAQIGNEQAGNPGVISALSGRPESKFIYRDDLNPFEGEHSDANLVQTYLPVRASTGHQVTGVFEIYTDVAPLVAYTEQAQLLIFPVVVGIFLLLYLVLLAVVRTAEVLIRRQADIINERNQTLEILSAKLLSAQEQERKQMAHLLHEEVAQILSGVKYQLTTTCTHRTGQALNPEEVDGLDTHIKNAIQEVRNLAMRIRPSSLDDMGLLKTLDWFLREFRRNNPGVELHDKFQATEEDIPKSLKIIIFRIIQDALNGLTVETEADRIGLTLVRRPEQISLLIEENAMDYHTELDDGDSRRIFELMNERAVLSGGEYEREPAAGNDVQHTASWRVA